MPERLREARARARSSTSRRRAPSRAWWRAGGGVNLAEIKAVSDGFPLRGRIRVADRARRAASARSRAGPQPGTVWIGVRARRAPGPRGGRHAQGGPRAAQGRGDHHARARQRARLLRHRAARADERGGPRGDGADPGGQPRRPIACWCAASTAAVERFRAEVHAEARARRAHRGRARRAQRGAHGARARAALPRPRVAALGGARLGRGRARGAALLAAPDRRGGDDALPGRDAGRHLRAARVAVRRARARGVRARQRSSGYGAQAVLARWLTRVLHRRAAAARARCRRCAAR